MIELDYNNLISNFDNTVWRFSYLTSEEIHRIMNIPIKFRNEIQISTYNGNYKAELTAFWLIGIKYGKLYDYSCQSDMIKILSKKFPRESFQTYDTINLKEACIVSGLGQRAKNTLIYNKDFKFNFHIVLASINNVKMKNLPQRELANYNILPSCVGCNDCILACPVQAINWDDNRKLSWIDLYKCASFCDFGNHPIISSRKWDCLRNRYNFQTIYNINDIHECINTIGKHINEFDQGGIMQICQECRNQNKCGI